MNHDPDENKFNFIVGIGRSGTTLLMSMLNAHPQVQATPEINFFNFFVKQWSSRTRFGRSEIGLIREFVMRYQHHNFSGFSFDFDAFEKQHHEGFADLYRNFYRNFLYGGQQKHAAFFFDKNPINTFYLADIIRLMPEARFVFLVRDPRASYLSRRQKKGKHPQGMRAIAYRWLLYNQEVMRVMEKYPEKFLLLRYEDLVASPEAELKRMAAFFGFPYDEQMLRFHENVSANSFRKVAESSTDERKQVKYLDLSRPVTTERSQAWRHELTATEIAEIDAITGTVAERLGYQTVGQGKPVAWRFQLFRAKLRARWAVLSDQLKTALPLRIKLSRTRRNV